MGRRMYVGYRGRGRSLSSRTRTTSRGKGPFRKMSRHKSKSKSRTRTRTKTKLTQKVKTSKDGPVSDSFVKYPFRGFGLGAFKKITAPLIYVVNESGYLQWTSGLQALTQPSPIYGCDDITHQFTMYAAHVPPDTAGAVTTKLYVEQCVAETMITNDTNAAIHMVLYDIIARRDLTTSSAAQTNYITPTAAWTQGSIDSSDTSAYEIVGSNPFQTPGFTEYYKVVKITNIDLHTGGHHRHKMIVAPRQTVSNDVVTELTASASTGVYGKVTCFTMIVCHGFPDNTTGGTTVSTSSGKIDWVTKKQYTFYPICSQRMIISSTDNLGTLATESIILDLTGAAASLTTV